jgi:hypothetical protein
MRTARLLICFPVFAVIDSLDLTEVDLAADPVVEFDRTQCPHADGVPAEVEVEPSRVTYPPRLNATEHQSGYHVIRGVIVEAAWEYGKQARQASFKGALQTITAFQEALRGAKPEGRRRLFAVMLKTIAGHRVGNRPGRVEPRANKRRPKPQRYLTEPRREARNRFLDTAL